MNQEEQALFLTLYYLDDTMLARACQVNKRFYNKICNNLWFQRLQQYDGVIETFPLEVQNKSIKDQYLLLRDLDQLKVLLKPFHDLTLLEIYQSTVLVVSHKRITELPSEIGNLINLEYLNVSHNQITELPLEIGKLPNLKTLSVYNDSKLYNNQLTELPHEIGELVISKPWSVLTELPREIGQLVNLKTLSVRNNQITELPLEIGKLINLKTLHVNNNQITDIPAEIRALPNITIYEK